MPLKSVYEDWCSEHDEWCVSDNILSHGTIREVPQSLIDRIAAHDKEGNDIQKELEALAQLL